MKLLVLSIKEEIPDFSSETFTVSKNYLFNNTYLLPDSINENFEHEILEYILSHQGDGISIYTSKHNKICFMDICLLVKEYNLENITSYFSNRFQLFDFNDTEEEIDEYGGLIKISGHIYDGIYEDIEKALYEAFQGLDISYSMVKKESKIFECGAGAEFVGIIIGILGLINSPIWAKIAQKLKEKEEFRNYVKFGDFNTKKLLLNFAYKIQDAHIKKFSIDDFDKRDDGNYKVIIRSKYKRYDLVCDNQSNILEISIF